MRRWIIATCVTLLAAGAALPAGAAGPIIDWDPAYAWQVGATPNNLPSGGEFKMVGTISQFGPPLDYLNAGNPAVEYTFYVHALISNGTVPTGPPATEFYTTTFTGGLIEVYFDSSPDASFDPNPPNAGVPADFIDGGPPLLTGIFTSFTVQTDNFTAFNIGTIEGDIVWTGGSELPSLNNGSGGTCPGLLTGGLTYYPPVSIPGYLYRHDGKIDQQCPTPTRKSTWGSIKSLYR